MLAYRTLLVFVLLSVVGGLSAYGYDQLPIQDPVTVSGKTSGSDTAETLYEQSLSLLLFGELKAAEARLLLSVERDPRHRASHKKLCALLASTSASNALSHCQAWERLETHGPARRFASRIVSRLTALAPAVAESP